MIDYIGQNLENRNSIGLIIGQIYITDPDVKENFTITFDKPSFRALEPARNAYSVISDEGFELSVSHNSHVFK